MDKLSKYTGKGFKQSKAVSVRKLNKVEEVKSLKVSPRGRLSVPKIVMQFYKLTLFRHFLTLEKEEPRELCLVLLTDKELKDQPNIKSGVKRILHYDKTAIDEGTTSYLELGPQLKKLGLLDGKGFMLNFRVEDNEVIILELSKKF